jgi:hypothetical protein
LPSQEAHKVRFDEKLLTPLEAHKARLMGDHFENNKSISWLYLLDLPQLCVLLGVTKAYKARLDERRARYVLPYYDKSDVLLLDPPAKISYDEWIMINYPNIEDWELVK